MLSILALLCFVVALFDRSLGEVDLVILGLAFLAAHLCLPVATPWRRVP